MCTCPDTSWPAYQSAKQLREVMNSSLGKIVCLCMYRVGVALLVTKDSILYPYMLPYLYCLSSSVGGQAEPTRPKDKPPTLSQRMNFVTWEWYHFATVPCLLNVKYVYSNKYRDINNVKTVQIFPVTNWLWGTDIWLPLTTDLTFLQSN